MHLERLRKPLENGKMQYGILRLSEQNLNSTGDREVQDPPMSPTITVQDPLEDSTTIITDLRDVLVQGQDLSEVQDPPKDPRPTAQDLLAEEKRPLFPLLRIRKHICNP